MEDKEDKVVGNFLPRVPVRALNGSELLGGLDARTVADYWRWAHSDILENVQRGVFAEYLVAAALGVTTSPRIGWSGFDIDYDGFKLEVKASAYLQAWNQRQLTSPRFGIGARQQLDEDGISYEADPRYVADCYVFALFAATDPATADVTDARQWKFYVVHIDQLIAACGTTKSISLRTVALLSSGETLYCELRERIENVKAGLIAPQGVVLRSGGLRREAPAQRRANAYLVARRKTRESGVIVDAEDYREAQLLARADSTIASYGTDVSAFRLSRPQVAEALRSGVRDLRQNGGEPRDSTNDLAKRSS